MQTKFRIGGGLIFDTSRAVYDPEVGAVVVKDKGRRQVPRREQARRAAAILASRPVDSAHHTDPLPF